MRHIPSRRLALLGSLAVLMTLLSAVVAARAAETITVVPDSTEYSKEGFTSNEGEVPLFAGDPNVQHNVTGKTRGPDGRRLFRSRTIAGGTTPVEGAQYLSAGRYVFECTVHFGMEATLVVDDEGTPKARPRVIAAVLRQTLTRVRNTGLLKVRLRSPTGARDVVAVAKGAGVRLARKGGIAIAKGGSRVVRLPLTRRGRAALAGRRSVKISLKATVPFGSPATASRTLGGG